MKKAINPEDYFAVIPMPWKDRVSVTVLYGIRLRALREYYFGKRERKGGRPIKPNTLGEFKTWAGMLRALTGIEVSCAENWMRLADAFERLAKREGIFLRETFEKPLWHWSPEESDLVTATVHKLCQGKTQLQIRKENPPN